MNIMNTVLGAISGGGEGGSNQLLTAVMGMLNGNPDEEGNAIGDLLSQFQAGGLGDTVQSWLGSGENMPISADQLTSVLGEGKLASLAQQAGISVDQLPDQLANLLPQAVDKMTPDGQVPSGSLDLGSIGSMLSGFLSK